MLVLGVSLCIRRRLGRWSRPELSRKTGPGLGLRRRVRPRLGLIEVEVAGWGVWGSRGGGTPGRMFAVETGGIGRGRGRPGRPCRAVLTRFCRSGLDRGWCGERGGKDGTGDGFCVPQAVQSFIKAGGRSGCGERLLALLLPPLLPLRVWCNACGCSSELMGRHRPVGWLAGWLVEVGRGLGQGRLQCCDVL